LIISFAIIREVNFEKGLAFTHLPATVFLALKGVAFRAFTKLYHRQMS
jgi:hypothetical protein